ncbi:hypothetical protein J2741_001387 [Methanolinea mesophila]|uniref:YIP1 family protein n=1 Tax=Methanolinea mesophila TaxID=547055 RepID=UPI001AE40F17|nr:YIP1 family protein [Methanolinea mesophila]MBP1928840.1 hypothetical protein [Methanolinea mesophila]
MEVLIRPDAFFSRIFAGEVSLKVPGLIAIVGAIVTAISAYVISGPTVKLISGAAGSSASGAMGLIGAFGAIGGFFAFLIGYWIIIAGIFHVISVIFKGKGSFHRTLTAGGYGLIPIIIGGIISALLALYYIPLVKVPVISSFSDPTAVTRAIAQLYADPAMREFTQISGIISIIFLIWSANIWIFGIKHARELSIRNAVITVGIPVVLLIVYIVVTTVFGVGIPGAA